MTPKAALDRALLSLTQAAARPSGWEVFQYRWHIWLGVWAAIAAGLSVVAWVTAARSTDSARPAPAPLRRLPSPYFWWPLPGLVVCAVYGAAPWWALCGGAALTMALPAMFPARPGANLEARVVPNGAGISPAGTLDRRAGWVLISVPVLSTWGLWTAIPDTEAPLCMAVSLTVTALTMSWPSHRAGVVERSTPNLTPEPAVLAASTAIAVTVATIGGSFTWGQRIAGLGCMGLTTALAFVPRIRPRSAQLPRSALLILFASHAVIVYLAARVASVAELPLTVALVVGGQAVAVSVGFYFRLGLQRSNRIGGSSRERPTL